MYLSELRLWNFRKFGSTDSFDIEIPNLELPFQKGLNLLVGENDSGKTAIVDAIKYVLLTNSREYIRLDVDDFYFDSTTGTSANKLRIECNFKFNPKDGDSKSKNFLDWGHFNGNGEYELRVFLEAELKNGKIEPYDIRGGIDNEGVVLDARARELLRVTYLKPLRDAKEELRPKKGSRLSQVLDSHSIFAVKDNHFLSQTVQFANKEIASFFKGENSHHIDLHEEIKTILSGYPSLKSDLRNVFKKYLINPPMKGDEIANKVNSYLTSFFGEEALVQFQISETSLRGILERLSLQLESTNAGLGSQNLLFIAVELLLLEREADFTGLRLALIEEIEAHLHPQAQMRLVEYLQERCNSENIQMLLTTHSPNLASKIKLENLIICQDNYAFPMGSDYTMLDKADYAFLERFLDVTKANLFFAKGVILVEGDAENLLLPTIAKIIDCDLTQHGVSIINLGGLTFKYYERVFIQKNKPQDKQMQIPVAVVTDVDIKVWEYYEDVANKPENASGVAKPKFIELNQDVIRHINAQYPNVFENIEEDVFNNVDDTKSYFRSVFANKPSKYLPRNGFGDYLEGLYAEIGTMGDLLQLQNKIQKIKVKKHSPIENNQVKGFVNTRWTLEYELGLSCLKYDFYTAILMAKAYGYFVPEELETYRNKSKEDINAWEGAGKTPEQIAYEIYWVKMMSRGKNKTSKAIVAHFFAEILEHEVKGSSTKKEVLKTQINADPYLKYLVDAIKHTTKKV